MKALVFILFMFMLVSPVLLMCKKENKSEIPILTTQVKEIYSTSAYCGGVFTDYGSGKISEKGVCWGKMKNPSINTFNTTEISEQINNQFYCPIYNLQPLTDYYVRAYAINDAGISYGNEILISTTGKAPAILSQYANCIGMNSINLGGIIDCDDINTRVSFEYGLSSDYGEEDTLVYSQWGYNTVTWFTFSGGVLTFLSDLLTGTTYHYRIKSINSVGITYGNDGLFTTADKPALDIVLNPDMNYGSVTDIAGNVYRTISIGSQIWMAENLRTTKFNDGTPLLRLPINHENNNSFYGYSWYNNDSLTYSLAFGALYNWYAINADNKNICPSGWHVPTNYEWITLANYLGGFTEAGGKLKETETVHWISPNTKATNSSGFTAVPGGFGFNNGKIFLRLGEMGYWWSSDSEDGNRAWAMYKNNGDLTFVNIYWASISIRCVQD